MPLRSFCNSYKTTRRRIPESSTVIWSNRTQSRGTIVHTLLRGNYKGPGRTKTAQRLRRHVDGWARSWRLSRWTAWWRNKTAFSKAERRSARIGWLWIHFIQPVHRSHTKYKNLWTIRWNRIYYPESVFLQLTFKEFFYSSLSPSLCTYNCVIMKHMCRNVLPF